MPELLATLTAKREAQHQDRKFFAALQGVDLDEAAGKSSEDEFERVRARAQARAAGLDPDSAAVANPNDIVSLQGARGAQAGFEIGVDLDYEVIE